MASQDAVASLPYHEPGIQTILIIVGLLLALNGVNYALDRIVYCGLVGQLFVGMAWGTPGADWLSEELQHSIVQLGYIGLILIVYEGGLSSNFKALKANLFLSSAVAVTGIAAPMGLSFVLLGIIPITPVQAFAAGAALCSTSLGTTFTVLATSGLTESRLGVVLTSAAMMDDVVGLVMVQIISSLGGSSSFSYVTVVRPVFVSLAFAVVYPLLCVCIARPAMRIMGRWAKRSDNAKVRAMLCSPQAALVYQTGVLLASITGATYAGTSNLFAAYLAGAAITWLDDTASNDEQQRIAGDRPSATRQTSQISVSSQPNEHITNETPHAARDASEPNARAAGSGRSGREIYERYYSPAVQSILRPLFFASIGFAIPITNMFSARVIWRGAVYTILMLFGKLICGIWLIRFASLPSPRVMTKSLARLAPTWLKSTKTPDQGAGGASDKPAQKPAASAAPQNEKEVDARASDPLRQSPSGATPQHAASGPSPTARTTNTTANTSRKRITLPRPKSLYPATILGSAMVSRGEIGFLISSVAESRGVFGESGSSDGFLVVTWAILLCTLIGPITVGLLVKRVKRLQQTERRAASGHEDPLGIWSVIPYAGATS